MSSSSAGGAAAGAGDADASTAASGAPSGRGGSPSGASGSSLWVAGDTDVDSRGGGSSSGGGGSSSGASGGSSSGGGGFSSGAGAGGSDADSGGGAPLGVTPRRATRGGDGGGAAMTVDRDARAGDGGSSEEDGTESGASVCEDDEEGRADVDGGGGGGDGGGGGGDGGGGGGSGGAAAARLARLTRRYEALMGDEALADCVVLVDGKPYPCVRSVLAQGSDFFKAMFFGACPMEERVTGRVTLGGVTKTGWEAVRFWLYTARKTKRRKLADFVDVIRGADRLCVPDLCACTAAEAAASLTNDNVVPLANLAWSGIGGLEVLQAATFEHLRAHFDDLCATDALCVDLHPPVFHRLASCPTLWVASEDALAAAVWRRLAARPQPRDAVAALLGTVRLPALGADALADWSAIARGGGTDLVPAPDGALRAAAADVALAGLARLAPVARPVGAPEGAGGGGRGRDRRPRSHVPGRSAYVVYHPRAGAARQQSAPFRAARHVWRLDVVEEAAGRVGAGVHLGAYVHRLGEATGAVKARATIWVSALDGCTFFPPAMEPSGEPHAALVFKGTITREWGHGECRGFAAVVPSDTLCLMRQRGQDTALLIGVTLRKAP